MRRRSKPRRLAGVEICSGPFRFESFVRILFFSSSGMGGTQDRRGYKWAYGRPLYSAMSTIAPPNSNLCMQWNHHNEGVLPPGSRHQGGCHVLMGDGAVIFLTDSIEAGNQEAGNQESAQVRRQAGYLVPGSKSPFGLWGALGTRASNETIEEQLNQ